MVPCQQNITVGLMQILKIETRLSPGKQARPI